MPIAYQEQTELTCPACRADFAAAVWLILDAQEAPEAAAALQRGELNQVTCPHCGATGPAGAPLLYHDGVLRRVIFAPAPGSAEYQWREQARDLHALLVGSIAEEQRRPYLADVAIAQDLAGVAQLLQRMDRRRGQAAPQPAPAAPLANAPAEQAPPLLVAVEALLAADTPAELETVLAAHPVLLDPGTDATLAQLIEVAVEQREFAIADSLRNARALLARMAAAPREAVAPPASDLPAAALQALLRAQNASELEAALVAYPVLRHAQADALLAEQIDLALDTGNERLAHALEQRREALAQLRAGAPDAIPDDPAPASLDEAIEALLVADGEAALVAVIDRYPVLLDEAAGQALWQFAAEARASGDEDLARYAIECRDLLRRVREALQG
ncbi:MAG: hypothetical protein HXY37_03500 [Chloroflexi bacterium]|nr:hypothetical protein [Chloroflexota bacterium]